jgi:hypothetical protein
MQAAPATSPRLISRLGLGFGLALALTACTKDHPPPPAARSTPQTTAPGPAMAAPAPRPTAPGEPGEASVAGTVVETMRSGGYTYAKLASEDGRQVWAAGPETPLAVGTKIGKVNGMLMSGFRSSTLNRTFDQIYFVSSFPVAGGDAANPHTTAAAAPRTPIAKVEPAKNGKTIAEIFASRDALAGKPIAVRGKVVKVNNGIMGHNWLHLQDGTGGPGTDDLVVTTDATVAKDDVVLLRGTVVTNKDFGAGYSYTVLIENAAVTGR